MGASNFLFSLVISQFDLFHSPCVQQNANCVFHNFCRVVKPQRLFGGILSISQKSAEKLQSTPSRSVLFWHFFLQSFYGEEVLTTLTQNLVEERNTHEIWFWQFCYNVSQGKNSNFMHSVVHSSTGCPNKFWTTYNPQQFQIMSLNFIRFQSSVRLIEVWLGQGSQNLLGHTVLE